MLTEASAAKDKSGGFSFVDTNGLGKPAIFKNNEGKIFGEQFRGLLERVEDQAQDPTPITMEALEDQVGDGADENDTIPDWKETASQLHVPLKVLTAGEGFSSTLRGAKASRQ
eukprot:8252848-Pyramimonas_sp.AAC.1